MIRGAENNSALVVRVTSPKGVSLPVSSYQYDGVNFSETNRHTLAASGVISIVSETSITASDWIGQVVQITHAESDAVQSDHVQSSWVQTQYCLVTQLKQRAISSQQYYAATLAVRSPLFQLHQQKHSRQWCDQSVTEVISQILTFNKMKATITCDETWPPVQCLLQVNQTDAAFVLSLCQQYQLMLTDVCWEPATPFIILSDNLSSMHTVIKKNDTTMGGTKNTGAGPQSLSQNLCYAPLSGQVLGGSRAYDIQINTTISGSVLTVKTNTFGLQVGQCVTISNHPLMDALTQYLIIASFFAASNLNPHYLSDNLQSSSSRLNANHECVITLKRLSDCTSPNPTLPVLTTAERSQNNLTKQTLLGQLAPPQKGQVSVEAQANDLPVVSASSAWAPFFVAVFVAIRNTTRRLHPVGM